MQSKNIDPISTGGNLLLEVDHIIPIIKGGLTKEDNLQTLCWKCNRSKGAKIVNPQHIEMPQEKSANIEKKLYRDEAELYRYYCITCKKQFKVKGAGKKIKCPKCGHFLHDMGVSDLKYEKMSKEERTAIINSISVL